MAAAPHAAAMAAVHASAFAPRDAWSAAVIATQLGLPGGFGYLDRYGGMVLARVAADQSEILTLAVMPQARRAGLGRALLTAALAEAARRGAVSACLEVGVDNDAAAALYAAAGFRRVGVRRRYYADGSDAWTLCRQLSAATAGE